MEIEVDNNFDEEFYEIILPEVKEYYTDSGLSKKERYYHHYLKYGQHLYENIQDAENKLFGNIEIEEDFEEKFYEKSHPQVKGYMLWEGDWINKLSTRKRYYHHYLKFKFYKNIGDAEEKLFGNINVPDSFDEDLHEEKYPEIKGYMMWMGDWVGELSKKKRYYHHYLKYCVPIKGVIEEKNKNDIKKKIIEIQKTCDDYKDSIVLVNHVSNPYGATHYLLTLFKSLKTKGFKVCLLDEIINEELYLKYGIDKKYVISYEQDLLLLCYLYEKLKPKVFYLNSINEIFVDFIKLKHPKVIVHSHEIEKAYGQYNILPDYVVSKRIQKEFEDKHNHKPEIQPPIFSSETLELIDKEFNKDLTKVSNHTGEIDQSKITIGMCGQTETRKNPKLFEEVSKLYPQYNFLWIGGEEEDFIETDNLYHIPAVQLPFVYYKLIDYFILFSQEDPCPYVVLENLYVNNKVITFKENIYTDHKCEQTKDIYFEFDGEVSVENLQKVIDERVIEKANRNGIGKKYIIDNYTKFNMLPFLKSSDEGIDYFIICHDQNIILDSLQKNKFSALPNYRFMFVGDKPTNLIDNIENVIICNKLKFNIENYPKLCSFTAWYAVSKNSLCKSKYCCLLEYDVELSKDFHGKNLKAISSADVCSYFVELIDDPMFSKSTPWLEIFFETHNINTSKIYEEKFWYCTTNFILRNDILAKFNNWFYEIASMFKDCDLGSYMHERMINIYCILNDIKIEYVKNQLKHFRICSHEKQDLYTISKNHNLDLNTLYNDSLSMCKNRLTAKKGNK